MFNKKDIQKINEHEKKAENLFNEVLNECLAIRMQRKEIYGNCWFQEDGVEANFWGGIINKINRIKILHKNRQEKNGYESYEDTLKDLVILTLFTLACVKDERNKS
jgi:hypothetical protein